MPKLTEYLSTTRVLCLSLVTLPSARDEPGTRIEDLEKAVQVNKELRTIRIDYNLKYFGSNARQRICEEAFRNPHVKHFVFSNVKVDGSVLGLFTGYVNFESISFESLSSFRLNAIHNALRCCAWLKTLHLVNIRKADNIIRDVGRFLAEKPPDLKELEITGCDLIDHLTTLLALTKGLRENKSLEVLKLIFRDPKCGAVLKGRSLEKLLPVVIVSRPSLRTLELEMSGTGLLFSVLTLSTIGRNTTLTRVVVRNLTRDPGVTFETARLVRKNSTIQELTLGLAPSRPEDRRRFRVATTPIAQALARNHSLTYFQLNDWAITTAREVYGCTIPRRLELTDDVQTMTVRAGTMTVLSGGLRCWLLPMTATERFNHQKKPSWLLQRHRPRERRRRRAASKLESGRGKDPTGTEVLVLVLRNSISFSWSSNLVQNFQPTRDRTPVKFKASAML